MKEAMAPLSTEQMTPIAREAGVKAGRGLVRIFTWNGGILLWALLGIGVGLYDAHQDDQKTQTIEQQKQQIQTLTQRLNQADQAAASARVAQEPSVCVPDCADDPTSTGHQDDAPQQ